MEPKAPVSNLVPFTPRRNEREFPIRASLLSDILLTFSDMTGSYADGKQPSDAAWQRLKRVSHELADEVDSKLRSANEG